LPTTARSSAGARGRFRLIVFDLDGTLIDSRRDLADAANATLESCGGAALPEERIGQMVGDGAATLVARAFQASGVAQPADALETFLAFYNRALLTHTRLYPGVAEALPELAGRATLALLTNKPIGSTREILDGLGIARFFQRGGVIGGDGPLGRKPDPAGLRQLLAAATVSATDALMVGDSVIDFRTGRAAAARICMARYGFGYHGFPVDELTADDYVIDEASELISL
jgi:phosphoglycolate phosphatase